MARLRRYKSLHTAHFYLRPGDTAEIHAKTSLTPDPIIFRAEKRSGGIIFGRILSPLGRGERRAVLKEFFAGFTPIPEALFLLLPDTIAVARGRANFYKGLSRSTFAIQFFVENVSPTRYARYIANALAVAVHTGYLVGDLYAKNAPYDVWLDTYIPGHSGIPGEQGIASTFYNVRLALWTVRKKFGEDFYARVLKRLRQYLSRDSTWSLDEIKKDLFRTQAALAALGYRIRPVDPHTLLLRTFQREGRITRF